MTVDQLLASIVGPVGALVLAVVALYVVARVVQTLWAEHLKADQDDRDQRDKALALLAELVPAVKQMAAAWDARNKADAARRRRGDS